MDWNKSKNIILVILLITNIFLIAVYGGGSFVQKKSENNNAYQYTMNVLEENNIVYKGQIYNKLPKMTTLTVSYGKYDRNLVQKNIKNTRSLPQADRNEPGYKNSADDLIERCGFMSENVVYEGISNDGTSTVASYSNVYKNIPIEECYMRVYFENGRITDFERKWMEVVSEGDSRIEVTLQLSALLEFMTETDKSKQITVDDMYLVYWIDNYDVDGGILYDTALPAWCIRYNDNDLKYISATVQ